MRLVFERGDPDAPRGHALIYFRQVDDPDSVWASYVVVAPIVMDLAKLIPPMFAAQMPAIPDGSIQAIPLPPFPEHVESKAWLDRLADCRADDLLAGGDLDPSDIQRAMMALVELAGEYGGLWASYSQRLSAAEPSPEEARALPEADDILLELMSNTEKVSRLARLAGTLRYAEEGGDAAVAAETAETMANVGRRLSEAYRVPELIQATRRTDPVGAQLARLYLECCYKLAAEEYGELERLDREIAGKRSE